MKKVTTQSKRLTDYTKKILAGGSAQYGAFAQSPTTGVEALLVTTRETGFWTIPKGWPIELPSKLQKEKRGKKLV